ncbi:MAG: hypothetical protein EOO09_20925 [Chitinophagaceae bacterium]|nr:MAG: hypothetical protein EOO09_20925 [Chitinophagaceae bacterium]
MQAIRRRYKKATSTRRGRIVLLSLLVLVLAAVAGGIVYWSVYKKQIIREQLESAIRNKSKGLYIITYDSLKLDEVAGNLSVSNFSMVFDSVRFQTLDKSNDAPPTLLRIKIPEIRVTGVKTPRALIENEIVGSTLLLRDPEIEIIYTNAGKDSLRSTPTREVYDQILGNLDLIRVDSVMITGAKISTRNFRSGKKGIELAGTDIRLFDVAIDSVSNLDSNRILFSKKIELAVASVRWASANKLYKYGADSIRLLSDSKTVSVGKFFIEPQLNEDAFVHSLPVQDDRFDFDVNGIRISGINFLELFNEHVIADSVIVRNGNFRIYRDLNIKRDKKNRVGTYPHQAIAKLKLPVQVSRLIVQNAYVEYKERGMVSKQSGRVKFFNARAVISNITNDKAVIAKNGIMTLDFHASLLNKAPLTTNWKFYLNSNRGKFTVSGHLGRVANAEDLSVLSEPMGPARIEDGDVKSLDFSFTADDYNANGQVKMIYDDLKVAILDRDEDTKKLEKKKLISFVANIIVKKSNPSGRKDEPRVIQVTNQRDPNRSMFHFAWKTLFKGIKESAGIKK